MSLVYWLPMTDGELHNQGLSDAIPINHGAVVNTNGKLGKCYSFDGTTSQYIDSGFKENFGLGDFSIAAWFKLTDSDTRTYQPIISNKTTGAVSVGCAIYYNHNMGSGNFLWSTADGSGATEVWAVANSAWAYSNIINTWHHIVMVRNISDPKVGYFYFDGVRYELTSVPPVRNITNTSYSMLVGGIVNPNANYAWTGSLNDIRIYDHALSPLEVKRLAQGLVLHYPLNRGGFGGDNIIAGTSPNEIQYTYPSSGYSDKFSPITTIVPTASQYTLSFWAKSTVDGDKVTSHYYSPNTTTTCVSNQGISKTASDGNMIFTLSTDWEYYWVTYTQTETTAVKHVIFPRIAAVNNQNNLPCIGSGTISVKCVKFEEGSMPTPWVPNQADALYSQMGLDNNIEYDVSGFGNNGTRVGTFSWSGDTPRYKVSTHAAGSSTTHLEGILLPAEAKTISLWIKGNKSTNGAIFNDKISGLQIGLLNSLIYTNSTASTNGFTTTHWKNGEWNHVVAVNKYTLYINGQPETQSDGTSNYYIHIADKFWLWNRSYNDSYAWTGDLSDLRIYTTALSADDVMALYKNAGYVDSNGDIYAHEITE